jgi:hypothetical protein
VVETSLHDREYEHLLAFRVAPLAAAIAALER